jgi:uncharacterized membrane protein
MTQGEQTAAGEARRSAEVPEPPMNRMVVSVLALVGFFDALYLWAHNAGLTGPIVCGVGDCETVQSSIYAKIGAVPVSAIGVAGYAALFALSIVGVQPGHRASKVVGGLLLAGATLGVAFSGWLTYLEARVIHAWCQYCVGSAIVMTILFFATLPEVGRLKRS